MNVYNQWRYANLPLGFDKKPSKIMGGNWCLICAICLLVSIIFGVPCYPLFLNLLLKRHNGYSEKNLVIWSNLADILQLKIKRRLWDGVNHPDIKSIKTPAIVSFDGIPSTDEYDSHFVVLLKKLKNGSILIFDPFIGSTKIIQNPDEDLIYSVIELEK